MRFATGALRLPVHLGVTADERAILQDIVVEASAEGDWPEELCRRATEAVRSFCEDGSFALIEKIGADLHSKLTDLLGAQARVTVSVHKLRPPVPGLEGGVIVRITP